MKSTFKKGTAGATDPAQEPAENTDRTLAETPKAGPLGAVKHQGKDDMFGEWLPKDSKLPRLNVVQRMSGPALADAFDLGDLVFASKIKLADTNTAVTVVPIQAGKDYQQKTPFGEGQGVVYPNAQAVLDNGGTLEYSKEAVQNQIYFGPRAHVQFAVKAPAGLSENDLNYFPFTFGNDKWAMSIMTVASSAFTSLAKELETLRRHNIIMLKGLMFGNLELKTLEKPGKPPQQSWWVPVIKLVGENPPGLIEFLDAIK